MSPSALLLIITHNLKIESAAVPLNDESLDRLALAHRSGPFAPRPSPGVLVFASAPLVAHGGSHGGAGGGVRSSAPRLGRGGAAPHGRVFVFRRRAHRARRRGVQEHRPRRGGRRDAVGRRDARRGAPRGPGNFLAASALADDPNATAAEATAGRSARGTRSGARDVTDRPGLLEAHAPTIASGADAVLVCGAPLAELERINDLGARRTAPSSPASAARARRGSSSTSATRSSTPRRRPPPTRRLARIRPSPPRPASLASSPTRAPRRSPGAPSASTARAGSGA